MRYEDQAAAVILTKGPRVLSFIREKDGQIGLPCGMIKPGETPAEAALRECLEETGYKVRLTDREPYVGFDPKGGKVVTTYFAETVEEVGIPSHSHEGKVVWLGVRELLGSGYSDYNRRAFRHFGIERPLAGKFHSHITIRAVLEEADRARALVGGKVTIIELERSEQQQVDIMLTHYYMVGNRGLDDHHDVLASLRSKAHLLGEAGIEVVRVKLEHELLDSASDPTDITHSMEIAEYVEVHIKCKCPVEIVDTLKGDASKMGWHPSRNPRQQIEGIATQFINRRFYDNPNLASVESDTDQMVRWASNMTNVQVTEVKMETAIYDDNGELDRWWMV